MPTTEVDVPDHLEAEIDRLVQQEEFINRDQAIEELLSLGVSAYDVEEETEGEVTEDVFTQSMADQQDPALREEPDEDEFTF